jgi:hypothetical protein
VTLRWETHALTATTPLDQSRSHSSRIAHSRMWGSWKASLFTFPILSMNITRKVGRAIMQYPNLSLAWLSILLQIAVRFIVYLQQRLPSVPFSVHILLFWKFLLGSNRLTPRMRDILEEEIVSPIVKKLPALYGALQYLQRPRFCCDPNESNI